MIKKINEIEDISTEELRRLSIKEIALIGNIDIVKLVIADCDIEKYLKYRLILIDNITELEELKEMYKTTEYWEPVIKKFKEEYKYDS